MLSMPGDARAPRIVTTKANFGTYPTVAGLSRLSARFYEDTEVLARLQASTGKALDAAAASALGLVTAAPDSLDWNDEVRIAIEERASLSPDALTGM
jgi:benzoyl-CoA-dihydrodiol lyase